MTSRRQFLIGAGTTALVLKIGPATAFASSRQATPVPASAEGFLHPEWLIEASALGEMIGSPGLRILALQKKEEFQESHIPGAMLVEYTQIGLDDTSESSVAAWRDAVAKLLATLGVRPDHTVVVYDGGSFHAARLWWLLEQVGHSDKRILNGGLAAWTAVGGATDSGDGTAPVPTDSYPVMANEDAVATIDEVIAALDTKSASFVDARYAEDYIKGHIPGATSIPVEVNAAADEPRYWKSASELDVIYSGIPKDVQVIPYCAGGVRSAATYFALRQLGYDNVALFTGSWKEWSAHPELPVTTGDAP